MQATANVTGFDQLLNFTTNLNQLDIKSSHKGSTFFVQDDFHSSKGQFLKTSSCITFEFSGYLRLPTTFNLKAVPQMIPGVSKRNLYALFWQPTYFHFDWYKGGLFESVRSIW